MAKHTAKGNRAHRTRNPLLGDIGEVVDAARRTAARQLNALMTAAYWAVGRRIVEEEARAAMPPVPDPALHDELAAHLTARFGRAYDAASLRTMRAFYLAHRLAGGRPGAELPGWLIDPSHPSRPASYLEELAVVAKAFPLPWSHYVRLLELPDRGEQAFYEAEALRRGWSIEELSEQLGRQLYEHHLARTDPEGVVRAGRLPLPRDRAARAEALRDPYLRAFLAVPSARRPPGARQHLMWNGRPVPEFVGEPMTWLQ